MKHAKIFPKLFLDNAKINFERFLKRIIIHIILFANKDDIGEFCIELSKED